MNKCKFFYIVTLFLIISGCEKNTDTNPTPQALPTITSISPTSGGANTIVTISGTNFSTNAFGNIVTFNSKPATIISGNNNSIVVSVPTNAGSGPVNVSVNNNTATGPVFNYTYTYMVSTIAGNGLPGFLNGSGTNSQFNFPEGIAIDAQNNLYVADAGNSCIRKISSAGLVTTFAGSKIRGFLDGRSDTAQFDAPLDVAVDLQGNVYVGDKNNHRIRKISNGIVTTYAGNSVGGFSDGSGSNAQFRLIKGMIIDMQGNIFLADQTNERIRKIAPGGMVTTLAGSGIQGFLNGAGNTSKFYWPQDVAVDASGNVYVADYLNERIRKITPNGVVSTYAGDGSNGYRDGNAGSAWFSSPVGIAVDQQGNVYVTDESNQVIRKITTSGMVSTIAGVRDVTGFVDGPGPSAKFYYPKSLAVDQQGNIYVSDFANHCIRKITIQ